MKHEAGHRRHRLRLRHTTHRSQSPLRLIHSSGSLIPGSIPWTRWYCQGPCNRPTGGHHVQRRAYEVIEHEDPSQPIQPPSKSRYYNAHPTSVPRRSDDSWHKNFEIHCISCCLMHNLGSVIQVSWTFTHLWGDSKQEKGVRINTSAIATFPVHTDFPLSLFPLA